VRGEQYLVTPEKTAFLVRSSQATWPGRTRPRPAEPEPGARSPELRLSERAPLHDSAASRFGTSILDLPSHFGLIASTS
jgi:hypothetical protein